MAARREQDGPPYGSVAPRRGSRAECQYVMEALGDVSLRVGHERLAGLVRILGGMRKPWLCATPRPLTCPHPTPSPGAMSAFVQSGKSLEAPSEPHPPAR
jgi:hypothetical protein